jgi:hypothetical protein
MVAWFRHRAGFDGQPSVSLGHQQKTRRPGIPSPQNLWKQSSPGPPNKQLWCGWGTRSKVGPGPISDAKEELSSPKVLQKISFCRQQHFH